MKLSISYDLDIPNVKVEKDDNRSKKSKMKHRSDSGSSSDSEASVFEIDNGASSVTGSDYSSAGSSIDYSSLSESKEEATSIKSAGKAWYQAVISDSDYTEFKNLSSSWARQRPWSHLLLPWPAADMQQQPASMPVSRNVTTQLLLAHAILQFQLTFIHIYTPSLGYI